MNKLVSKFKDQSVPDLKTLNDNDAHPFLFVLDELAIFGKSEKQIGISFMTAIRRALHFFTSQ